MNRKIYEIASPVLLEPNFRIKTAINVINIINLPFPILKQAHFHKIDQYLIHPNSILLRVNWSTTNF